MNEDQAVDRLSSSREAEQTPQMSLVSSWLSSNLNPDMLQPIRSHLSLLATSDPFAFSIHATISNLDEPLWKKQRHTSKLMEHGHPIAGQSIAISGFQGKLLYTPLEELLKENKVQPIPVYEERKVPEQKQRLSDLTKNDTQGMSAAIERPLYEIRVHDTLEEISKLYAAIFKREVPNTWQEAFTKRLPLIQENFERSIVDRLREAQFMTAPPQEHELLALPLDEILIRAIRLLTPFHNSVPVDEPGGHSYTYQIDRAASIKFFEDPVGFLAGIDFFTVKLIADRIHNGATLHPDTPWFEKNYSIQSLRNTFAAIAETPQEKRNQLFALLNDNRQQEMTHAANENMKEVASYKRPIEFFKTAYTINSASTNFLDPTLWPLREFPAYAENSVLEKAVHASSRVLSRSLWVASNALASFAYRNALVTFLYDAGGRMSPEKFIQLDALAEEHVRNLSPRSEFSDIRGTEGPDIYNGMWRALAAAENNERWIMSPHEYVKDVRQEKEPERKWLPETGWRKDTRWHIASSLALSALGSRWAREFGEFEEMRDVGKPFYEHKRLIMPRQEAVTKELSRGTSR